MAMISLSHHCLQNTHSKSHWLIPDHLIDDPGWILETVVLNLGSFFALGQSNTVEFRDGSSYQVMYNLRIALFCKKKKFVMKRKIGHSKYTWS